MCASIAESHARQSSSGPAGALTRILARQCRTGPAEAGALIRIIAGGRVEVLAVHPEMEDPSSPPGWLSDASGRAARHGADPRAKWLPPENGSAALVVVPIAEGPGGQRIFAVYSMPEEVDDPALVVERLTASAAGLHMVEAQGDLARQGGEIERLHRAVSTLTGIAGHDRFQAVAMALCNHIASAWKCERVSLGIAAGAYVRVAAMSHTEKVVAKASLTQDVESVMEECFDQDLEIVAPEEPGGSVLCRASREFAFRHGPMALCSVPIRRNGSPFAVLTLERAASEPFTLAEVAALRLLADAAAAQIWMSHRYQRWFGATFAASMRSMIEGLLGPRHAWAKLTAAGLVAVTAFVVLVPGTYRVRGDARVEAEERRIVAAPFDGFLREANATVGSVVEAGAVLARLDTTDLLLRLGALRAEQDGALREAALAQRERKDAEAQIQRARARKAAAEIEYLEHQVEQAGVRSPASGTVIAGELDRMIGAPVSVGDVLFEVAPLDSLHVEVFVEEDQIADISVGAVGTLATASRPDVRLPVEVTRIDPVAELREARNVFRVRAALREQPDWLRPGMEGTVRIEAGKRSYAWIWSRRTVNWIRMRLWI